MLYITQFYRTVFYECGLLPEAVDVCFKSIFVFNLQYDAAAHSVFYLHRVVYDMRTAAVKNPPKLWCCFVIPHRMN